MDNKLISIIIPIYNGEKYLKRCLDSIVQQTYKNLDIILIDDGSTDNSGKICDEYAQKDSRIVVVHKENEGIVSARNYGLSIVKGEYIAFSDQDDITDQFMYEKCIQRIENDNTDLCVCECNKIYNNLSKDFIKIKENCIIQGKEKIKSEIMLPLLCKCAQMSINLKTCLDNICENYYGFIWNAVYKSKIIKDNDIRFVKYINYEDDHLFMLNYLKQCNSISFEKCKGYFWRIYNNSTSHSSKYNTKLEEKIERLTEHYINILKECVNEDEIKMYKEELYKQNMKWIIANETLSDNPKSNEESIQYLDEMFERFIIKNNVDLTKKIKFNWRSFRNEYIRYCLGRHSMKYIFYVDKYIYNKFFVYIKNLIKK